jgi:hypothetical protein
MGSVGASIVTEFHYVRNWHKADMLNALTNVRFFGAKRTLTNRCLPTRFI